MCTSSCAARFIAMQNDSKLRVSLWENRPKCLSSLQCLHILSNYWLYPNPERSISVVPDTNFRKHLELFIYYVESTTKAEPGWSKAVWHYSRVHCICYRDNYTWIKPSYALNNCAQRKLYLLRWDTWTTWHSFSPFWCALINHYFRYLFHSTWTLWTVFSFWSIKRRPTRGLLQFLKPLI